MRPSLWIFALSVCLCTATIGAGTRDSLTVTPWTSFTMVIGATSVAPGKASCLSSPSSSCVENAQWRRIGDTMEISYTYGTTTSSGATSGTGTYLFSLPDSAVIDTTKIAIGSDFAGNSVVGHASGYFPGSPGVWAQVMDGFVWAYSSTQLMIGLGFGGSTLAVGSSTTPIDNSPAMYRFLARVPIVGWSTPLRLGRNARL